MRTALLAGLAVALQFAGPPVLAASYFVRPGGSDTCTGLVNTDAPGAGTACAWRSLDKCDAILNAGDSCTVSAGTYSEILAPASSGASASSRITYSCPSRGCIVDPPSGDSLDLRFKSWITVDGFVFEDGQLQPWGGSSTGNILDNISTRDTDGQFPYSVINTAGGSDNILRNFFLDLPPDNVARLPVLAVGSNASTSELRTLIQNGVVRGGWNGFAMKSCTDCTLDGVKITGAKNHALDIGNGGLGIKNLTYKNCVIMAGTGFRENNPQVLGSVNGLSVINSAIIGGYLLPSIGHETHLSGTVKVRNNLFFNAGLNGGETIGQVNNKSGVTWDIDWNGYVYSGNPGITFWRDSRGAATVNHPRSSMAGWQAQGFDQHSIVIENTDYRSGSSGDASVLWGPDGPAWGAMVECSVDSSNFETHDQWGEAILVGDVLEYDWDGIRRTVTSVTAGAGGNDCDKRIGFTPPLASAPKQNNWFLSWGRTAGTGKTYALQAGSKAIDAGDDTSCAHPFNGPHCDLGPVEFGTGTADTQKPSIPANLSATAGSSIGLTWSASIDNVGVAGYNILRSTVSGSGYTPIGSGSALSFTDSAGTPGVTYYYVVNAFDAGGNISANSAQAWAVFSGTGTDTQPPTAPTSLGATPGPSLIALAWLPSTDNVGVTGYKVLRSTASGGTYSQITTTVLPVHVDLSGLFGVTYFYKIQAFDAAGNVSAHSNTASGSQGVGDSQAPSIPAGLTAAAGNASATLAWSASTDNVGVTGYQVWRSLTATGPATQIATSTTTGYLDTAVTNGTKYYYTVKAVDGAGNTSANSNQAIATPNVPQDTQPPTAPTSLFAAAGNARATLQWTAATDNVAVTGYRILRSRSSSSGFALRGTSPVVTYTDTTARNGIRFFYKVEALDAAGNVSGASNVASAKPLSTLPLASDSGDGSGNAGAVGAEGSSAAVPPVPAGFSGSAGTGSVTLTWEPQGDLSGLAGFIVNRSEQADSVPAMMDQVEDPAAGSYVDTTVTDGTTYYYTIQSAAEDGSGSPATGPFIATAGGLRPLLPPERLIAIAGDAIVFLLWTPATNPDPESPLSYRIYRQEDPEVGFVFLSESTDITWTDTGARNGVTYLYRITAVDGFGTESAATAESEAAPWRGDPGDEGSGRQIGGE